MIDSSMLPDFIIEAREHLEELESSLLRLEKHQQDKDVLNDIFRSMHTIKGAAQFVGIDRVSELSHKLESLLDLIRRKEQHLNEDILDLLIDGKDRISTLVDELEHTRAEETDVDDLILRIKNTVEGTDKSAPDADSVIAAQDENRTRDEKVDVSEGIESALDSLFSDLDESPAGDDQQDLEAVLDSTLSNTFDASSEDAELENKPAALENEALEEEYDEELLAIFMGQLKENIPLLHVQIDELATSVDKQDVLNRCTNAIKSLKSSANYMGYETLTHHYTTWQKAIDGAVVALSSSQEPDLGFMQSFIGEIIKAYPQAMEAESQKGSGNSDISDGVASALDSLFSDLGESSAGDDQQALEAVLDASLSDTFDAPLEDVELENKPAALESEAAEEEYDEELLAIFMGQLKEDIPLLHEQIDELATSDEKQDVLNRCTNVIKSLKSSANYMGYEKLTHHYTTWQKAIDDAVVALSSSQEPDLGFMQFFIGEIIKAYPQVMVAEPQEDFGNSDDSQGIASALDSLFSDLDKSPAGDDQQALDAALNSTLTDTFDAPSEDAEQQNKPAALESEATEEEYDEELLTIFMGQLKEDIPLLHVQIDELATSVDKQDVLNRCTNAIKSLKSSANYMGYEALTHHYTTWQKAIDDAVVALSSSQEPDLGFMQSFIGEIIKAYPQAMEAEPQEETSGTTLQGLEDAVADSDDDFEDVTDTIGSLLSDTPIAAADNVKEEKTVDESEKEGMHAAENKEAVDALSDSEGEEQELFNKLSVALDASLEQAENAPVKPMHGVIEEMITSSGEENFAEEVSQDHSPSQAIEQFSKQKVPPRLDASVQSAPEPDITTPIQGEADAKQFDRRREEERRQTQRRLVGRRSQQDGAATKIKKSMRVDADKIDFMMNQVGELVVSRAYFAQLFNEMKGLQQDLLENFGLTKNELKPLNEFGFRLGEAGVALGRVSKELQEGVMKVRMLPIDQLFKRYPRLVRDLVHKTDKQVTLETRGKETELDKMVIEEISDPLIHIIRNAVDHGIETAMERKRLGKPESGTLTLEAYNESDHIVIEVTDDGRGLDVDRVKSKALAMGLHGVEELDRMTHMELINLVMQPGFSTAERTTKTSGRGVGMDVVKKNIEKLNGSVEIETKAGKGTRIRIKIPLTMAIIQALMVRVGNEKFTIPLRAVEETLRVFQQEISEIEGIDVIHLRDTTMPIFKLFKLFGIEREIQDKEKFFVVVVRTGMQTLGLVVDELLGQEEVVIKPLADYLRKDSGFAGATVLGDGGISLILDIPELVQMTTEKQITKQRKMFHGSRMPDRGHVEQQEQSIH